MTRRGCFMGEKQSLKSNGTVPLNTCTYTKGGGLYWMYACYYGWRVHCCYVHVCFVKWQRVALPTRWRTSVRTLFYCYLTFLDHRTNISRKVRAPRCVSASGAPNKFQNCHLNKTNMDKTSQYPLYRTVAAVCWGSSPPTGKKTANDNVRQRGSPYPIQYIPQLYGDDIWL